MTYNKFLYNTSLYTAGREEERGIVNSIIQAHTGPHIQAVVGSTSGVSFISDFVITVGTVKKPPTEFKFPDLTAFIRAYQITPSSGGQADGLAIDDLDAFIRGFGFKDMPACVFPSDKIPDLKAIIFGLFEANLAAIIIGALGEHDLPASLFVVGVIPSPVPGGPADLSAFIRRHPDADLGVRIHSPLDLPATMIPVQFRDLLADIRGFQFANLPGFMLGIPAPQIKGFIKGFAADILDLPTKTTASLRPTDMSGFINPTIPGPSDFVATVRGSGGIDNLLGAIRTVTPGLRDIGAAIQTGGEHNLGVVMNFLGAQNLQGTIGTIAVGAQDKFLPALVQPVNPADLGATMTLSENVAFLGATILSLHDEADLTAFLRVSETFVTAILTISTLASASLRATIGNPACAGGTGNANLSALTTAQHKGDLSAVLQSFLELNLGASINTKDLFYAFDTIDISFSPFKERLNFSFRATDTIPVLFSPFRGQNLGATLTAIQNNVFLPATITAVFPLPAVIPAIEVLQAVDIRNNPERSPQEIRLRLEGTLIEYLYVNGTDQAFIKDPNADDWKINIRSFRPIAEGLFGDFAAARICRLGSLTSFATMDAAVRFCIQSVIGLEQEANMSAFINVTGQLDDLSALVGVSSNLGDMAGFINQVFPADFGAQIFPRGSSANLGAFIGGGSTSSSSDMSAFLGRVENFDLIATVSGAGTVKLLGAFIDPTEIETLGATIDSTKNTKSILFGGTDEYIAGSTTLGGLGFGEDPRQFSVAFWIKHDDVADPNGPTEIDSTGLGVWTSILGAASTFPPVRNPDTTGVGWDDGFGFFWEDSGGGSKTIRFWVNDFNNNRAPSNSITLNAWHHVVGTYDADLASANLKIYVDGVLQGTDNHTADVTGLTNLFEIGRVGPDQVADGFPFQYMDEICVWSGVALSSSEVAEIHDLPSLDLRATRGAYTRADKIAVYYQFENTTITFPSVHNVVASGTASGTMTNMEVADIVNDFPV